MSVEVETIAAEQARGVAEQLLRVARRGGTEADFRREAVRVLEEAGARAGLTIAAFRRYFQASDPFWSMFNISEFTFSPWTVVWREQADELIAAVVGPQDSRPLIPDHKIMMVACSSPLEAHFLCAAPNCAPSRLIVQAYTIQTQMDTHILEKVAVPQFSKSDRVHSRLAELSQAAHEDTVRGQTAEVGVIDHEIDRVAARLWGLKDEDLAEIRRSLEEA